MSKFYLSIIIVLLLIIISLSIAISVYKSKISGLEEDIEHYKRELASCNSAILFQNAEIERHKHNIEQKQAEYDNSTKAIKEKYSKLLEINTDNKSCEEKLQIIHQSQREFLQ